MPRAKTLKDGRPNEANMAATCPVCHAVVSNRTDLPRHMRIHSNDKDKFMHRCPYPNCTFENLQKSNVETHIRTHTKTKTNSCPECDFTTADPGSLTRHRKRIHGYIPKIRRSRHPKPRTGVYSEEQIQANLAENSGLTVQMNQDPASAAEPGGVPRNRPSPSISATPEYEYPHANSNLSHTRFISSFDSDESLGPMTLRRVSQARLEREPNDCGQIRSASAEENCPPGMTRRSMSKSPQRPAWPHQRDPFGPLDP